MSKLGNYLRKVRLDRGHTLREVGDALGRGTSWVSDVEHGRRGSRMDPVIAALWADFLAIDAQPLLDSIGLSGERAELSRVRHHLETGQWAHKFLKAEEVAGKLQVEIARISATLEGKASGVVFQDDLTTLKSLANTCKGLLRVPRKHEPDEKPPEGTEW